MGRVTCFELDVKIAVDSLFKPKRAIRNSNRLAFFIATFEILF